MKRSCLFINCQMKQRNSSKSREGRVSFVLSFSHPSSLLLVCLVSHIFHPAERHFAFLFPGLQFAHLTWKITRTGQVAKAELAMVKTAEEPVGSGRAAPCASIAPQPAPLCLPFRGAGYGREEGQPPRDTLSHSSQFADIKQLHGVVVLTLSHLLSS